MMVSYDELVAGSDIHISREVAGAVVMFARPDCQQEFDTLVAHLYEALDRDFAIFPKLGEAGLYESAEIIRLN